MSKKLTYPEKVLKAYDAIERLLVKNRPLYKANSVVSDCLMMVLDDLYEAKPEPETRNTQPETI